MFATLFQTLGLTADPNNTNNPKPAPTNETALRNDIARLERVMRDNKVDTAAAADAGNHDEANKAAVAALHAGRLLSRKKEELLQLMDRNRAVEATNALAIEAAATEHGLVQVGPRSWKRVEATAE